MKGLNVTVLICGCIALCGSLLPVATSGQLYVNVHHLGGLTLLLYGLPLVLIIASILALYGKIKNTLPWYLPASIAGTVLSFLSVIAGSSHIKTFHYLERQWLDRIFSKVASTPVEDISVSPGIGGILMIGSYALVVIVSAVYLVKFLKSKPVHNEK